MKGLPLMNVILKQYQLDADNGAHGIKHWERVWHIGNRLADLNGADKKVISYFALLHDACREDEGEDKNHGPRAVEFIQQHKQYIDLDKPQFNKLIVAIGGHTGGSISKDITIGTAWDADRLDLGRVWIMTDKQYLSTQASKEEDFFYWATKLYQNKRKKVTEWIQ
jgi:uncharacterized protein